MKNEDKFKNSQLRGKFGVRLKDAPATLTMRMETYAFVEAAGVWKPAIGTIIVGRSGSGGSNLALVRGMS